jgi:hypothetical protein
MDLLFRPAARSASPRRFFIPSDITSSDADVANEAAETISTTPSRLRGLEQPTGTAKHHRRASVDASHVIKKAELDQLRMDRHGSLRMACLYPLAAHWVLRNGDLFSARSPLDEILIC